MPVKTDNLIKPRNIHRHFSKIARKYRDLRITDLEPIVFIAEELEALAHLPHIVAADVGCGAGRYDLLLFRHLGNRLQLKCLDVNKRMVKALAVHMKEHGVDTCPAIRSGAERLPLKDESLDCIFTFNAIHHFDVLKFFQECSRVLRRGGYLFVYTRMWEQNRKNIWGNYFPQFWEKETRLHKVGTLEQAVGGVPGLSLQSIELFQYARTSSLERLEFLATHRHYSTFSLYVDGELEAALKGFRLNIETHFPDTFCVNWMDENTMLVIRKNS